MPTVEISKRDLEKLCKRKFSEQELHEAMMYAKGEIDSVEGDEIKVDIKDTNRPDLWSIEGIAREIKGRFDESGLPKYSVKKSGQHIKILKSVGKVRPFVVCVIVRSVKFTDESIKQLMQIQEKIHLTYGRKRKRVSIGVHDLDKVKGPFVYKAINPTKIKFVPLDMEKKMNLKEILEKHPKGKEYSWILKKYKKYPIILDKHNHVLSFPPIINGELTRVTEKTKNLFIDVTGLNLSAIKYALNVLVAAFLEREASIESVELIYPDEKIVTPDLTPQDFEVNSEEVREFLGLEISDKEIVKLLKQARFDAKVSGKKIKLKIPAYRPDIMNWRDIAEDVAISFGYNDIEIEEPRIATTGEAGELEEFSDKIRVMMVGAGIQEIMTFILTNKNNVFGKMNLKEEEICEIENPVSETWSCMRSWLLPSLLEFLSKNKHNVYPQKIFEVGDVVKIDETEETGTKDVRKLACAISDVEINYSYLVSVLDALLKNLGISYKLKKSIHHSFIQGRVAEVFVGKNSIGVIGEIRPSVLEKWYLEKPVMGFEIDLEELFKSTS